MGTGLDIGPGTGALMGTGTGSQATWRMLLGYIRPHRWALLAGGLLSLATGATGLALPLAARALVGDLGHHQGAAAVLALMAGLVPGNAGTGAPGSCLLRRTAGSAVPAARRRLADRLLRLRISALDSAGPGDLISRVTGDTTLLREVTTDALTGLVTGSLTLAATLTLMGLPDAVLLAVTLGVFTLAGLVSGLVLPRIRRYARRAQEPAGVMGAALERVLGAFRTIKASGAEWQEGQRVHDAARQAWRADLRAAKLQAVAGNTAALAAQAAFLAVLAAGGARVASGAITVGTLAAFLLYVFYLMSPIQQVVSAISQYQVGACSTPETRPWSVTWDDGVAVLVRLVYRSLATLLSWLALLARSSASENAPPATPASASPTPANTLHTQRRHRALTQPPKAVGPRTS